MKLTSRLVAAVAALAAANACGERALTIGEYTDEVRKRVAA